MPPQSRRPAFDIELLRKHLDAFVKGEGVAAHLHGFGDQAVEQAVHGHHRQHFSRGDTVEKRRIHLDPHAAARFRDAQALRESRVFACARGVRHHQVAVDPAIRKCLAQDMALKGYVVEIALHSR